jgi:hypothetical protein
MEINGHQLPPGLEFMAGRVRRATVGMTRVKNLVPGEVVYESQERQPHHRLTVIELRHPTREECHGVVGLSTRDVVAVVENTESGSTGWIAGTVYR